MELTTEQLKAKFYDEYTFTDSLGIATQYPNADLIWKWIELNCLQKQEENATIENISRLKPSNVDEIYIDEHEDNNDAIEFAKWAKNNGWSYNVWDDNKWHNKANTHFSTITSIELYKLFKESKQNNAGELLCKCCNIESRKNKNADYCKKCGNDI